MNRKKKALLLASIASLAILSGCGSKNPEINKLQIDGETYVQNGDEYVKVYISPKVFEPGQHRIAYVTEAKGSYNFHSGWDSIYTGIEVPEGYELTGISTASENDGYTDVIIYTFVNTKRVEAEGTYNSRINSIEYITPGRVVEEKVLEMGD